MLSAVNYMGRNSLEGASQQIKDLGLKKALIVTDAVCQLTVSSCDCRFAEL